MHCLNDFRDSNRKILKTLLAVVLCGLVWNLFMPRLTFAQDKFQFVAYEYPPFFIKEEGKVTGIAVDLTCEVARRLGIDLQVDIFPIKRSLKLVEEGTKDGVMILLKTQKREEIFVFSDTVMTMKGLLWYNVDRPQIAEKLKKLEDLSHYRVGLTRGYSYGKVFDRLLSKMSVDIANSDLANLKKLVNHRIDIFPCDSIAAKSLFAQDPELKKHLTYLSADDAPFVTWEFRMAISKLSPLSNRINEINRIISDLKSEGYIKQLVQAYVQ